MTSVKQLVRDILNNVITFSIHLKNYQIKGSLYSVEQAFHCSKSDMLDMRPCFVRCEENTKWQGISCNTGLHNNKTLEKIMVLNESIGSGMNIAVISIMHS